MKTPSSTKPSVPEAAAAFGNSYCGGALARRVYAVHGRQVGDGLFSRARSAALACRGRGAAVWNGGDGGEGTRPKTRRACIVSLLHSRRAAGFLMICYYHLHERCAQLHNNNITYVYYAQSGPPSRAAEAEVRYASRFSFTHIIFYIYAYVREQTERLYFITIIRATIYYLGCGTLTNQWRSTMWFSNIWPTRSF